MRETYILKPHILPNFSHFVSVLCVLCYMSHGAVVIYCIPLVFTSICITYHHHLYISFFILLIWDFDDWPLVITSGQFYSHTSILTPIPMPWGTMGKWLITKSIVDAKQITKSLDRLPFLTRITNNYNIVNEDEGYRKNVQCTYHPVNGTRV